MRIRDFFDRFVTTKKQYGGTDTVIINIPPELYYKELAVYTASSLISNAISRSEIQCFVDGKPQKNEDYFLLNISPNKNETSSFFWHKVVNKMIRHGEALVVEANNRLYCADGYCLKEERPIQGNTYDRVSVGNFQFSKTFTPTNSYLIRLDNIFVRELIDGMYEHYGRILNAAAKQFGGQKYKIHIANAQAGDEEFNRKFEENIASRLKEYLKSENAVFPEYDGYTLSADTQTKGGAGDFIELKENLFKTVASAFHIPETMMTGNINSLESVIGSFLTFGVDPFADAITEALNKNCGCDNYIGGARYFVNTSRITHRDVFNMAAGAGTLISNAVMCVDEIREELGIAPLNTNWSRKHFITKNYEQIDEFLTAAKGGGDA